MGILFHANAVETGMNPNVLSPDMGILWSRLGFLALDKENIELTPA